MEINSREKRYKSVGQRAKTTLVMGWAAIIGESSQNWKKITWKRLKSVGQKGKNNLNLVSMLNKPKGGH